MNDHSLYKAVRFILENEASRIVKGTVSQREIESVIEVLQRNDEPGFPDIALTVFHIYRCTQTAIHNVNQSEFNRIKRVSNKKYFDELLTLI